jgi:hypothetical protein
MKAEDIVRKVLDEYVGSQINIDSEAARDILAKHIATELETTDFWNNLDQGQTYKTDYVDSDISI